MLLLSCSFLRPAARRPLVIRCTSQHHRFLSSSLKLGLGAHKWARMAPEQYAQVVQTALDQGIRLVEAGQEGGDKALADILSSPPSDLVVTTRLGYRTLDGSKLTRRWDGDVTVEKQTDAEEIVHNITMDHLDHLLQESPLLSNSALHVIPLIHNPEVQTHHQNATVLYQKLVEAFCGMEQAVHEGRIPSFGVVSNGLSLTESHPLHLSWKTVLEAAAEAVQKVSPSSGSSNLSILQLPANVLETKGLQVARDIKESLKDSAPQHWPRDLQVVGMRPLTWYPDQGTGTAHPVNIVDYRIGTANYTNEMEGPPLQYQAALNEALSHFDGTTLLEEQKERDLTVDERETLEGCKLLQSILHDLDVGLDHIESFAQYENDLFTKVIPTLDGHFEGLDEESTRVLQEFFAAHGQAVRYAVATKTRAKLLQEGYKIPPSTKLQEFALEHVLKEDAFSKVIVGCTSPAQVVENVAVAKKAMSD